MKYRPHWILTLAAAMVVAGPALASPAASRTSVEPLATSWETVAASGQVEARLEAASDIWQSVRRGDELQPQTVVQTGKKGRATLTRSASLMILDPSSQVELPGAQLGSIETSVVQTEGSVLYKVDSRANPHFEVVTPYLVAGVKGTSFLVTVNERYASISVEHGLVEVTNPASGDVEELAAGESIVRYHDEHDMELISDMRGSRDARRQSKQLDRMVRRHHQWKNDASAVTDARLHTDNVPVGGLQPADMQQPNALPILGTGDPTQLPGPGGSAVGVDLDLSTDLIEEMIREGLRDGSFGPIDSVVPLPDPGDPVGPGTPGTPGDPIDPRDPVDPNILGK